LTAARTLWEWASAAAAPDERAKVLQSVGAAIRRLHDCGGRHPDLNLTNILVQSIDGAPRITLIDFDRGRPAAQPRRAAAADLARLRRSARKLDPRGVHMTAEDIEAIEAGYRDGDA
jgi:tRNA A-37 threonylcarbamoyl transferase component Bud32